MTTLTQVIKELSAHHVHNVMDLNATGNHNDEQDTRALEISEGLRLAILESLDYCEGVWDEDAAHEIADGHVSVYTAQRFRDLGIVAAAWSVDISEFGEPEDLCQAAGWALYEAYRAAIENLVQYAQDQADEDTDED